MDSHDAHKTETYYIRVQGFRNDCEFKLNSNSALRLALSSTTLEPEVKPVLVAPVFDRQFHFILIKKSFDIYFTSPISKIQIAMRMRVRQT